MSKQLTPLEALRSIVNHLDLDVLLGGDYRNYKRDIKIVETTLIDNEKKLKALEIIVKKCVSYKDFTEWLDENPNATYELFLIDNDEGCCYRFADELLTQEEFDLIKEVVKSYDL